jgi:hypothetical protein
VGDKILQLDRLSECTTASLEDRIKILNEYMRITQSFTLGKPLSVEAEYGLMLEQTIVFNERIEQERENNTGMIKVPVSGISKSELKRFADCDTEDSVIMLLDELLGFNSTFKDRSMLMYEYMGVKSYSYCGRGASYEEEYKLALEQLIVYNKEHGLT